METLITVFFAAIAVGALLYTAFGSKKNRQEIKRLSEELKEKRAIFENKKSEFEENLKLFNELKSKNDQLRAEWEEKKAKNDALHAEWEKKLKTYDETTQKVNHLTKRRPWIEKRY